MNFLSFPDAPCLGATQLFFANDGRGEHSNQRAKAAKAVCADCPHILPCRQYAVDNNETFGIWGGMTEKERRRWRYEQRNPRKTTTQFWATQDQKLDRDFTSLLGVLCDAMTEWDAEHAQRNRAA